VGRFLLGQLRHQRSRALTLGAGILVAAVSFVLLTSAVSTSSLQVQGTVASNWRTAYDILVRPPNSFTPLERQEGLVADNYLSGIFGGITLKQWREIQKISGVDVAAPIANIGYVLPFVSGAVTSPINQFLNGDSVQLYRLRLSWPANGGVSTYPGTTLYIYYTRVHQMVAETSSDSSLAELREVIPGGGDLQVCSHFSDGLPAPKGPFELSRPDGNFSYLACFSALSPQVRGQNLFFDPLPEGTVGTKVDAFLPILLSAIDPQQEEQLLGLDRTVTSGRYLKERERWRRYQGKLVGFQTQVPVLASTRTYVDQSLDVTVERLAIPKAADVPKALASPSAFHFMTSLSGVHLGIISKSAEDLYAAELGSAESSDQGLNVNGYWSTSPISYREEGPDRLVAQPVKNPRSVWASPLLESGFEPAPPGSQDVQFRGLTPHAKIYHGIPGGFFGAVLKPVGRFNPESLPGFSPLSQVPLESYYPPAADPADESSRRALSDQPLGPTMSAGDYIAQPPLMLTTLQGMQPFLNPEYYEGSSPKAPISVIRVRVAGVTGPDQVSRERVRRVAQAIRGTTGLAVDITAGSSPHPLLIQVPPGKFGRPALTLREGWTKKGVTFAIISALDRKSLVLFFLVLVVSALFLANGAFASIRSRRSEIGVLLCLGWSTGRIFRAMLGELAIVGLVAGVLGAGLAALLAEVLSLQMSPTRSLLVAPVAVALACLAGLVPAWRVTQAVPLDVVRPPVTAPKRARPIRGLARMAAANLLRLPGRTLLGAGALLVGVGALAFLLSVNLAFRGTLVGTLLGEVISVQVRGVDYLSVALAIILGGLSVADVLFLNLKERAAELVTLRTTGWRKSHLGRLVVTEGIAIGVVGALLGAGVGLALGVAVGGPVGRVGQAALLAALAGLAVAALASLIPALLVGRLTPPTVLAEE
jgi:putative ABC transport system permease protein